MADLRPVDFARIARDLHGEEGVDATADLVAELARRELGCDAAGVMLVHRGGVVETAASTDALVERAHRLQIETGQGPCLEALAADSAFVIDDTETEPRWRDWCVEVAGLGIRSALAVRMFTTRGTLGSLNLYAKAPHRFSEEDIRLGTIFAGHASVAVATEKTASELQEAMEGRHTIGLAQGILMESFGLDKDKAFAVLRRYSQGHNMKLRVVAQHVATTRRLPD